MASNALEAQRALKLVMCPDCGIQRMRRLARAGFFQKKFWPMFGFYPWECPTCRRPQLLRYRGKRNRLES